MLRDVWQSVGIPSKPENCFALGTEHFAKCRARCRAPLQLRNSLQQLLQFVLELLLRFPEQICTSVYLPTDRTFSLPAPRPQVYVVTHISYFLAYSRSSAKVYLYVQTVLLPLSEHPRKPVYLRAGGTSTSARVSLQIHLLVGRGCPFTSAHSSANLRTHAFKGFGGAVSVCESGDTLLYKHVLPLPSAPKVCLKTTQLQLST